MLRAPKELYTASDRNTDKGKDNPSSFKLSNSMGVGLHQKEDLREGCSKTFLHDLKTVRAAASHQAGPGVNQGSRRKSERSSTIPHEQSFLGTPALCFLPQCLARTLVQEFHQTEREREREREREEWALLSGQIVSGMSLCFSINSITSLTETPNTLGDSKV